VNDPLCPQCNPHLALEALGLLALVLLPVLLMALYDRLAPKPAPRPRRVARRAPGAAGPDDAGSPVADFFLFRAMDADRRRMWAEDDARARADDAFRRHPDGPARPDLPL
jgi:hypothetical protein